MIRTSISPTRMPQAAFSVIELLTVLGIIATFAALLVPAFLRGREDSRRVACVNNLKQIDLALHSYLTSFSVLPSGSYDAPAAGLVESVDGARQFGWIYSLLPFLEQRFVWSAINLAVGPRDPENRTASQVRFSALLCPLASSGQRAVAAGGGVDDQMAGRTSYAGCHHDVEAPIALDNHGVLYLNSAVRVVDVADGLAFTVFLGELAVPSPLGWLTGTRSTLRNTGHPINRVDPAAFPLLAKAGGTAWSAPLPAAKLELAIEDGTITPLPRFVGGFGSTHFGAGANFAFGDGSVRFLKETVDASVYQRLGHRADGEPIDDEPY